jgi:hypothetical protein
MSFGAPAIGIGAGADEHPPSATASAGTIVQSIRFMASSATNTGRSVGQ